jgi:hypothetical protein
MEPLELADSDHITAVDVREVFGKRGWVDRSVGVVLTGLDRFWAGFTDEGRGCVW